MNRSWWVAIAFVMALFGSEQLAWAAPTVIDFEDAPSGTPISNRYAPKGVVWSSGGSFVNVYDPSRTVAKPHSGTHLAAQFQAEFAGAPMSMQFLAPQSHVSFWGGSIERTAVGTARAFDAANHVVASDGPKALVSGSAQVQFDLTSATQNIARVEFVTNPPGNAALTDIALDDLSFEGAPPPPVPTGPVAVQFTTPTNGQAVDAATFTVSGTVTGSGLPASIVVTVDHARAPGDLSPADSASMPLTGAGATRAFSGSVRLPPGPVTIATRVENSGGVTGAASVSLVNLPPSLRDSVGDLGALNYAIRAQSCEVAVYANGARATSGANGYRMNAGLLPKWNAWVRAKATSGVAPDYFCPTEDARVALGATTRQNFVGGRMYADPARGVLFVPAVFAQAIDALGGEAATGVPLADPQTAPAARTWLFQRFVRGVGGLPSTLEIKGSPPQLWVERQGGDLEVMQKASVAFTPSTATIVEHFPCNGNQGPCAVAHATSDPPIADAGNRFCKGTTFALLPPPQGPDEWVPVLGSHTRAVPLAGWVTESGPAGADDCASHEFCQSRGDASFWADWTLQVQPIHPYRSLLASNPQLEVEVEYYTAQYFFIKFNAAPNPGDFYMAQGRWIIDCGHGDYASEIHPPFASALVRTTGTAAQPTTTASIWVNGYYRGDAPLEFQLFPPPRIAPNAYMTVSRTRTEDAAAGVTVIDSGDPDFADADYFSFVRARFSAPQLAPNVGWAGLLHFLKGRAYGGNWTLGWEVESQYQVAALSQTWWP